MFISISVSIYIYIHIYVYTYMYIHTHTYIYTHAHIYTGIMGTVARADVMEGPQERSVEAKLSDAGVGARR